MVLRTVRDNFVAEAIRILANTPITPAYYNLEGMTAV